MIPTKPRPLPVGAVSPGLDLDDGGKRLRREKSVLVVADLWAAQLRRLRDRGAVITQTDDLLATITLLANRDFDAVILSLDAPKVGLWSVTSSMEVLKSIKGGSKTVTMEAVIAEELKTFLSTETNAPSTSAQLPKSDELAARERHRLTPFFVVTAREQEFAIIVRPPEHSYLEDGKGISLADAVMCLDVGKLLQRGPALA